ncbi:hypothetical protein [Halorubrum sp. SD683]|uniref:hypothetical protein n=1 Tax=Halorubrum sp. SD683 TaxID=1855873 RepID=UPI00117996DF|nr:hypothetical protein [Halorubrum sp. SD683]
MPEFGPGGRLRGKDMVVDEIGYELDYQTEDEYAWVLLTLDLGFTEVEVQFDSEKAEQFIVEFRDELVKAKQEQLEYDTNTDPDSGVCATDGGVDE